MNERLGLSSIPTPSVWVVVALLTTLAGCGDPQTYVGFRNDDDVDYLVALAEPGWEDIPGMRVIRAGNARTINLIGEWHGIVGLIEPETCRLLDRVDIRQLDNLLVIRDSRLSAAELTNEGRFEDEPDDTGGCPAFELPIAQ